MEFLRHTLLYSFYTSAVCLCAPVRLGFVGLLLPALLTEGKSLFSTLSWGFDFC